MSEKLLVLLFALGLSYEFSLAIVLASPNGGISLGAIRDGPQTIAIGESPGVGPSATSATMNMGDGNIFGGMGGFFSDVDNKVDACLENFKKGAVNIYANLNPVDIEMKMIKMLRNFIQGDGHQNMSGITRDLQDIISNMTGNSSTVRAIYRKLTAIKLSNAAKYVDLLIDGISPDLVNVAFSNNGKTWHYISGTSPLDHLNSTEVTKEVRTLEADLGKMGPYAKYSGHSTQGTLQNILIERFKHNISANLRNGVIRQALGEKIPFSNKPIAGFTSKVAYQLAITTGNVNVTELSFNHIVDIFGRFSNDPANAHETNLNVLVASPPQVAIAFLPSIRLAICKADSGVDEKEPLRLKRPNTIMFPAYSFVGEENNVGTSDIKDTYFPIITTTTKRNSFSTTSHSTGSSATTRRVTTSTGTTHKTEHPTTITTHRAESTTSKRSGAISTTLRTTSTTTTLHPRRINE